jgi:tripartite-type tricarboxylate transporter receptor subunit TctC
VTIVFPFAAGSGTDAYLKYLAEKLSKQLGQPVVVENRPGAGGNIGGAFVARSAPDGHTLFAGPVGPLVFADLMFKEPGFKPMEDLLPVTMIMNFPTILLAASNTNIKSVADLIAEAKAKPGTITFGTAGVGSTPHLAIELLAQMAGVKLVHVPYTGASQAVMDVQTGSIALSADLVGTSLAGIAAGRMRGIGVSSKERMKAVPDVPTIAETLPGYESTLWIALAAPAGTPLALRKEIATAIDKVLEEPDSVAKLADTGGYPPDHGVEAMDAHMKAERVKWSKVIKELGIQPQ